uniref:SH3 domain-containing protein n=1 Tax=Acrobeloides nanus TaxID=290746 RepID=A0A914CNQ8_9BILA
MNKFLDLLYKRRACAANAAIAQQRCVNFTTGPNKPRIQSSKSSALNSVLQNNLANKDVNHSRRPQASVGPFQIKKSSLQNNSEAINSNNNNSSISSSPMHHNSLRESALSNPINYPKNQNFGDHNVMIKKTSHPYHLAEFQRLAETNNKKERSNNLSNSIVNDELRYRKGRADIITLRNDSLKAAKRRSWAQSEASENENILRILLEEQRKGKSHLTFTDLFPIKSTKKYSLKNTSIEETENAVHQTTTSDVNRKLDEEKSNLNSLNETIQKNPIHTPKTVKVTIHPVIESHDKEPIKYAESQINTDPPIEDLFVDDVNNIVKEYEEIKKDENNDKVLDNEILEYIELKETELKNSLTSEESSTDEESSLNEELPVFLEAAKELNQTIKPILKTSGKKNVHRNIVFDPFVLFLDGALEGQLDTVKENATKIADISMPNDEGITALHNAICACHYEIVKFLIDNHANVNAQDSDGWTPLHCAASCNNLIMVKMLVENGACIYAITLSDAETPAKKCEENEDGYVSCANYLELADKWAGIINNKIMYAIYSYDPQEEDELMFMEGDSLCVIDRNTKALGSAALEHYSEALFGNSAWNLRSEALHLSDTEGRPGAPYAFCFQFINRRKKS